ncbi:MAG: phosphatase PAP2 family protein [Cypionkella sp.]
MNRAIADLPALARRARLPALSPPARLIAGTLAGAAVAAAAIVRAAGMTIEPAGFARFALLAAAMLALSRWCARRYPDPRLAHAAAIVGSGTLALLLCGLISNTGLRLGAPLIDPALVRLDAAFGLDVEAAVRAFAAYPRAIALLAAMYNLSGPVVVLTILLAVAAGRPGKAWELTATAIISMQVVAIFAAAFPAIGAMAHLGMEDLQGSGVPVGAGVYHLAAFEHFRDGASGVVRLADLDGVVTFPSFHTVLALLAAQALHDTRWRWLGIGWSAGVIVSTAPIGGHYVTDLAAGCIVWLGAAALARRAVSSPSA